MSIKNIVFSVLLIFVPISVVAHYQHWGPLVEFGLACLAILPLAAWIGTATEEIAVVVGPSLGGLLNATFGNAAELIISLVALKAGLVNVVKASLVGSIVGNLLLVMGLAMFLGGLRHKEQTFQSIVARTNASAMNLAVIALLLPAAVNFTSEGIEEPLMQKISIAVAIILILVYISSIFFSMKTHSYLYDVGVAEFEGGETDAEHSNHKPNLKVWISVLIVATVFVALESELLVGSLEEATKILGLTELFTGVILLPIIGNAAENAAAIVVATKNKMDLSLSVAVGASMQVALFVTPVLVITGWFWGQPMDLNFNPFELVAVAIAVLIANSISSDGRSNWFEGLLLLAAYGVLAVAFFYHPVIEGIG
ncbi:MULTISPECIES: calcium/proton exchanger [unclassified Leptolyngbya]|uniref:calcium/proton exchanger n=1 Tax=unclassified Leptolyngbya TaxID=2650499 RepID=UPI0016829AD3|nr:MULTISPECIES: calcium/proton exchanger [unclassified Leptolyngbya]MBD1911831.1 calcium/proton exchanger [Leptolyngbya sp. FACHB-8]MBD2158934.1 calcium/proton exchanger [Leptolyngbya sp. FACHB-16]